MAKPGELMDERVKKFQSFGPLSIFPLEGFPSSAPDATNYSFRFRERKLSSAEGEALESAERNYFLVIITQKFQAFALYSARAGDSSALEAPARWVSGNFTLGRRYFLRRPCLRPTVKAPDTSKKQKICNYCLPTACACTIFVVCTVCTLHIPTNYLNR